MSSRVVLGAVYQSNGYGSFTVIGYKDRNNITIKFDLTGYIKVVRSRSIYTGTIKDPTYPSIKGVGCVGDGPYNTTDGSKHTHEYQVWYSMIERCYCEKSLAKFPSYKNVVVCDDWLNFQNFAKWYHDTHPDGDRMSLDKDILAGDQLIYSPHTCSWVPVAINTMEMTGALNKWWIFHKDGVDYEVHNINKFAKDRDLLPSGFRNIINKTNLTYKGFRWVRTEER